MRKLGVTVVDTGYQRLWPEDLDELIMEQRVKHNRKYREIADWLVAQGFHSATMEKVKRSVRYHLLKKAGLSRAERREPGKASLELRDPLPSGHDVPWGCLNSLLPNCGPLHYRPGI